MFWMMEKCMAEERNRGIDNRREHGKKNFRFVEFKMIQIVKQQNFKFKMSSKTLNSTSFFLTVPTFSILLRKFYHSKWTIKLIKINRKTALRPVDLPFDPCRGNKTAKQKSDVDFYFVAALFSFKSIRKFSIDENFPQKSLTFLWTRSENSH